VARIEAKVMEPGANHLGQNLALPQPTNKWRISQFSFGVHEDVKSNRLNEEPVEDKFLEIALRFPRLLRSWAYGRGLDGMRSLSVATQVVAPVHGTLDLLVIAEWLPAPDRQAGLLRLSGLLEILAARYRVHFFTCKVLDQILNYGMNAVAAYEASLRKLGITVHYGDHVVLNRVLHRNRFAIVLFEHYRFAEPYIDQVRLSQPQARTVIDTIDINFERLQSKARATGKRSDLKRARREKVAELAAYRRCDVVIAISDQDRATLLREDSNLTVDVIPLIIQVPELRPPRTWSSANGSSCSLLFVGNFEHTANVDAILLFCATIFPGIKAEIPYARLKVVGNGPPEAVRNLANKDVQVLGFVPDIGPYYANSDISVAPLTWGGGLKGKVAEAMGYGLPVVATTIATDGFGLHPGEDVVLGDTPAEFISGVVKLHKDRSYYERISANGRKFVDANYSWNAIKTRVDTVFQNVERAPIGKPPLRKLLGRQAADLMDRHILWRLRRNN